MISLAACNSGDNRKSDQQNGSTTPIEVVVALPQSPREYIDQLGCLNCHGGSTVPNQLNGKAPDLSYAGARYQPAYLFEYLQNPSRVRNHIGISRMPDFQLEEQEALALTLYLTDQKKSSSVQFPDFSESGNVNLGKDDFSTLVCTACHAVNGNGNAVISDLSNVGTKLKPDWLKQFMAAPSAFSQKENLMPGFLYHFNSDSTALEPSLDDAAERIVNLSAYLMSLESPDHDGQLDKFEEVKAANPEVTAEVGKKIFQAQNCAGCHNSSEEGQWRDVVAPNLLGVNERLNKNWLTKYLKTPHAIRPFGFFPGSGSRMPDFDLSEDEIKNIVDFLYESDGVNQGVEKPSQFVSNKIELLLDEQFSCLGCHALNGKGGQIGPELSNLGTRLNASYIALIISNPAVAMPGTIMPKISMPDNLRKQLIGYLTHNKDTTSHKNYLSLIDHPIVLPNENIDAESIYLSKCASCHGATGNGNGFNAAFLPTPPTKHADSKHMSSRPDDTLFDGIYAGGYILNKSHTMPPWGNVLTNNEISGLVKYMRGLCDCKPPEWSTDNLVIK